VRYANTAAALRRVAGGWSFDVASIPGGLAYALAKDGAARARNPALVPERASFRAPFRDPAAGRAGTRRYGVAFMWSPRLLLWRHTIRKHAPATWGPLSWNTKARRGKVALEDTPLQIGDAALSLRTLDPALGITDPYALDEAQFAAALTLTSRRLALAGALWQLAGDEIDAFEGGLVDVGAGDWYTAGELRGREVDVGLTLPREGAAGEIDLWMLGANALHPGCAYRWMRYASGARVQAQVARAFGTTPVSAGACALLGANACAALHADVPRAFLNRIAFRHTPVEGCGGGRRCVPFARWEKAWAEVRAR
jgi:putative spermidine/putrescine transport system substrate-binding protein